MAANDVKTRYSPAWWMQVLTDEQSKRLPRLNTLQAWLDNNPPLPEGAPSWKAAYQEFHSDTRTNIAALAVSSVRDRLTPLGFRTGASDDDNGDELAAEVWSENQMPVQTVDLLGWMLGLSDAYTMVGPPRKGERIPIVTVEDPRQVITANNPMRQQEVLAGIKTLHDPYESQDICHIYLPAGDKYNPNRATVYTARKKAARGSNWGKDFRFRSSSWTWDDEVTYLPTKRVPIGRLANRGGVSEFEPHLGLLGRINRITLQRMLIGEIQAFRQRAIEGLPRYYPDDFPVEAMRGKEIDYEGVFTPGPGSMWMVPQGAKFWESQPIDIRPLLDEERMEFRTASAVMGIPVSYFNPDDTNGSAEGASLQREGLIYRAEDRQTIAEAGLNLTMSLAFEMMGDSTRMKLSEIETIWAPIERLSLTERYNAAVQAKAAGESIRTIRREVLKYTPRQLRMAESDDMDAALLMPNQPQLDPLQVLSQRADRQPAPRRSRPEIEPASQPPAGR